MTDISTALSIRIGGHTDNTDFSTTPVGAAPNAIADVFPEKFDGVGRPARRTLQRNPAHPQNKRYPGVVGPYEIKAIPLDFMLRGLNGNTGAAINAVGKNDLATVGIYQALFGAAPVDPAGAVTASTGGAGGLNTVAAADRTGLLVGGGVLVPTASGVFARQITATGAGAGNITLDRVVPGAIVIGNLIRASRFKVNPALSAHTHCFIRAEWENARRDFKGCMSLGVFDYPLNEAAMLRTSWMWTDMADVAEADPAVTDPTTGGVPVNDNCFFYIGDTPIYAQDCSVDLGGNMVPRKANSGPQGVQGYLVMKGAATPKPKIMVTIPSGTFTGEVADTGALSANSLGDETVNLGSAKATLDISLQIGTVAGSTHLWRAPAAECTQREDVTIDGQRWMKCVFECNQGSDANFGPLEHLIY